MAAGTGRDPQRVSVAEVAELLGRLRRLSDAGRDADEGERERFLADKDALIGRIEADTSAAPSARVADPRSYDRQVHDATAELVAGVDGPRSEQRHREWLRAGPSEAELDADELFDGPAYGAPVCAGGRYCDGYCDGAHAGYADAAQDGADEDGPGRWM